MNDMLEGCNCRQAFNFGWNTTEPVVKIVKCGKHADGVKMPVKYNGPESGLF